MFLFGKILNFSIAAMYPEYTLSYSYKLNKKCMCTIFKVRAMQKFELFISQMNVQNDKEVVRVLNPLENKSIYVVLHVYMVFLHGTKKNFKLRSSYVQNSHFGIMHIV